MLAIIIIINECDYRLEEGTGWEDRVLGGILQEDRQWHRHHQDGTCHLLSTFLGRAPSNDVSPVLISFPRGRYY